MCLGSRSEGRSEGCRLLVVGVGVGEEGRRLLVGGVVEVVAGLGIAVAVDLREEGGRERVDGEA
jgi:hypothetical protein